MSAGQPSPVLGLTPGAFADQAAVAAALDALAQSLLIGAPTGVTLDAPVAVPSRSAWLPLAGVWRRTFAEDRLVPFRRCAALVAVHDETGAARVAAAFPFKDPAGPELPPDEAAPEGAMADPFSLDAVARLGPLDGGTWSLSLVALGYASNTVRVRVEPAAAQLTPPRSAVWPVPGDGRFPSYRPSAASPALSEALGLSLDLGRVVLSREGTACVLHASGRVASPWVCPLDRPPGVAGDDYARGALPVTFVVCAANLPEPWQCTVTAAVYEALDASSARVYLSLDLFALPGFPRGARTLYLWAFTSGLRAGPALMALVTPEMLAPA